MPAITQSHSQSWLDLTHKSQQHIASMPSKYHVEEYCNKLFSNFSSIFDQPQPMLLAKVNKLIQERILDLLKHPAHNAFNLPSCHVFTSVNKFQHTVNINRAHMLHFLACMIGYDVAAHKKTMDEHAKLKTLEQDHTI